MSRIKDFYNKYLSRINAYWLVIIGFLILTFTVGDSNLYKRYTYDEKIRSLEREIKHYQKEIEINRTIFVPTKKVWNASPVKNIS